MLIKGLLAGAGLTATALYDATEAFRLAGTLMERGCATDDCDVQPKWVSLPGGWWQALELYLASLVQVATLLEMAGSHEDAFLAFEEGLTLVRLSFNA